MTTFAQGSRLGTRVGAARAATQAKKYDIRVVDQFYGYCDAVARTHRHREHARARSQFATRRAIVAMVFVGGMLCYYLLERVAQFVSL